MRGSTHPRIPSPAGIDDATRVRTRSRGTRSRRTRAVIVGVVAALTGALAVLGAGPVAAAPAAAATGAPISVSALAKPASCPTVAWGSKVKKKSGHTTSTVRNVRAGSHLCYERVVIDLGPGSPKTGYLVRYVDTVRQEGSGKAVKLAGGAKLEVIVKAAAYDIDKGTATYQPANPKRLVSTKGFHTVRQVAFAGSFEGQTTFGIGVRARLPFRVLVLKGPGAGQRLVIDIARGW